jgi:hypothetical protein
MSSSQNHRDNGPPKDRWITSPWSGDKNECVEMFFPADPSPDGPVVLIRDSTNPEGGTFDLPASGWRGLTTAARRK